MLYPNFTAYFSKAKNSEGFSEIDRGRALNAVTFVQDTGPFVGGTGDIVVWNEHVEPNDISLNFVGCHATGVSIYVGYGVFPKHSGDTKSRIFISTMVEGVYCFNDAKCMNFVQVDSTYKLGDILDVSDYNDPTNRRVLQASLDKVKDKWWVTLNHVRIGYFNNNVMARTECRAILWGGVVLWAGPKATSTQMGNGHFPKKEDPMHCGAISRAFAVNKNGVTDEKPYRYIVDNPKCYDFTQTSASDFQYGGSGSLSGDCT